jgi:hypothetical protein
MSPITDRTMRIPSGVASPITTNHAVTGSVFVKLTNPGNLKIGLQGSHLTESRNGVLPPQRTQPLRLQRLRTRVEASGYSVQGSGCKVQGSGFRVQGSGLRVQGPGFRVQGSGLRPSVYRGLFR